MKSNLELFMEAQEVHDTWLTKHGGYARDMTMRDEFAGRAMQGDLIGGVHHDNFDITAKRAYIMADAMLKARDAK